ncbi:MAG: hypothetical protein MSG64_15775 [Pyrinomonadaceae bacterium MAG19_C2-C3]|nr:hypothetical protein [Pyrinomonadaceae bacterium MAG19_C2-C3]
MAYRKRLHGSRRYNESLARAREAKERARLESPAPDYPLNLPELRRRIIVESYDFGEMTHHEINLYRSGRVDCYRVVIDGEQVARRMGWARVLELVRKAFVRVSA